MKLYICQEKNDKCQIYESQDKETINEMEQRISKDIKLDIIYCGRSISNKTMLVQSFFQDGDIVQVQQKQVLKQNVDKPIHYQQLTKYTFYDYDDMNVKVILELPEIEKLNMDQIQSRFFSTSFEIKIHNYKEANYVFAISRTQCKLNTNDSKVTTRKNKLIITIRKLKKEDNWFSIYKQKTIGGDDSD